MERTNSLPNHTIKHIIILLAAILLISGSVTALKENFEAYAGQTDISMCACDLLIDKINVQNTGEITSTFMLEATGDAAKWVNLAPQSFYLEQNEIKDIERFIKVPCRARGEYELNTTIRTLFENEKILSQKLNVENCQNVQVIPRFSGIQEECPCTPVQYDFEVINTGNHIETYDISVEPYSDAVTLSTDTIILEPGEKQTISVFISLECGSYGEKTFTFNALAEGTKIVGQADFTLNINKCYDYELDVGEEFGICQGIPNVIPFSIQNNATIANVYQVTATGAGWAYPENDTIQIGEMGRADSNLVLIPANDDEDRYTITLEAISARGEEIRAKEITVETEKCFDYELIETPDVFKAAECKPKTHIFTLKNTGARDTTYIFEIEGLEWMRTSASPITLKAGEERQIKIEGTTPCDYVGEYAENVFVTILDVNQTYEENKIVSVYPKEDAFMPKIDITDMNVDGNGGETQFTITNNGFEKARYIITLNASDWVTTSVDDVELLPGENETATIVAVPTNETEQDTYLAEMTLSVPGENVEYTTEFLITYKEKSNALLWIILASGMILALLVITIIVLVFKKKGKETEPKEEKTKLKENITIEKREYKRFVKEEKKTRFWPILVILALALIIGTATYYSINSGMFTSDKNETNETEQPPIEEIEETPRPEEIPTGVLTNEDIREALITIDRSAIAGDGNTLKITNETILNIPISITNPTDRKARFTIHTQENSWINFDKDKVSVMPNSTELITLTITPDIEALQKNDYAITINTTLEGKKIYYEETLELIITKEKSRLLDYLPWALGGLAIAGALILLITILRRERKPEAMKEIKKEKRKEERKERKTEKKEGVRILPLMISIIVIIIIASIGFWAYNLTRTAGTETEETENIVKVTQDVPAEIENEDIPVKVEDTKITEETAEQPLITLDRTSVSGEDDEFIVEQTEYILPITVTNPTDRKARFTVNMSDDGWVSFEKTKILVEPKSDKIINMTLTPDLEALKENDYSVTISTSLQGEEIDYNEELNFVLTQKKKFPYMYTVYALIGLIMLLAAFTAIRKAAAKIKKIRHERKQVKGSVEIRKNISVLRKKTVQRAKKTR